MLAWRLDRLTMRIFPPGTSPHLGSLAWNESPLRHRGRILNLPFRGIRCISGLLSRYGLSECCFSSTSSGSLEPAIRKTSVWRCLSETIVPVPHIDQFITNARWIYSELCEIWFVSKRLRRQSSFHERKYGELFKNGSIGCVMLVCHATKECMPSATASCIEFTIGRERIGGDLTTKRVD